MDRILQEWIMDVPPVTRYYAIGIVTVSALQFTGYVSKTDCYYSYDKVFNNFEIWRLITSFFYLDNLSWRLCLKLYDLLNHSKSLELSYFKTIDYIWMLFLLCLTLIISASYFNDGFILGEYLNSMLLYIWSRKNPNLEMRLYIITIKSRYLPFLELVFQGSFFTSVFNSNDIWRKIIQNHSIMGILLGHLFVFLEDMYPKLHCSLPLTRPIWEWFDTPKTYEVIQGEGEVIDMDDTLDIETDVELEPEVEPEVEPVDPYIPNEDTLLNQRTGF
ncbi:hypothetical protein CANARDRAFT_9841 [[Candida] arabinofermentans NRRL YB-2248]|uniref:Derlin n=1 Tax=[Candida] arabinofermentans NRRL YB-2248 TaxID=983967 RepID=A0A1E4SUC0_9ASCO|nr:hypothetical protein CANARDRAFT_9841 [[Candida] arabinofermentans NRRL YB-2248]